MPRTTITVQPLGDTNDTPTITFEAFDEANGMDFEMLGGELIIVETPNAGTSTLHLVANADDAGWTASDDAKKIIAGAVAADQFSFKGPVSLARFQQPDGKGQIDFVSKTSNTPVIAVVRIPR